MEYSQEKSDRVGFVDSMSAVTFDVDKGRFQATYDSNRDLPSLATVAVVATALGRDPLVLDTLHSIIDTDALDKLVTESANGRADCVRVSFCYEGSEVTVSSEEVVVEIEK